MPVTITKRETTVTIEVKYDVADVPDINRRYSKTLVFRPDKLVVTFVNGVPHGILIGGRRVLKARLSDERLSQAYGLSWERDDVPAWVGPYLVLDK